MFSQTPRSTQHKQAKWTTIGTVAAAVIALVGLYGVFKDNGPNVVNNNGKTEITNITRDGKDTVQKIVKQTVLTPSTTTTPASAAPKVTNLWNGQLETTLLKTLSDKGFKNVGRVSCNLVLSDPDKVSDNRLRYTFTLTVDFFRPAEKKPCGQLVCSSYVNTDAADTKDRIFDQGIYGHDGLFANLEKETNFPPCINP